MHIVRVTNMDGLYFIAIISKKCIKIELQTIKNLYRSTCCRSNNISVTGNEVMKI